LRRENEGGEGRGWEGAERGLEELGDQLNAQVGNTNKAGGRRERHVNAR
jgi:hypothetical protein